MKTEQELLDREIIEFQFHDNLAFVRSPGFGDTWITVCVVETATETVLEDPNKWLHWFYGDAWPRMVLIIADDRGSRYYINKELVVGYDVLKRIAIRTYPAPDRYLDILDSSKSTMWHNRIAYVYKPHVAPERTEYRKKNKVDIVNVDDMMHTVSL